MFLILSIGINEILSIKFDHTINLQKINKRKKYKPRYCMYIVYLGGSAPKDLCYQNPWNVLVVQDSFHRVEIKNNSKDCCSSCKNEKCTLSCEIIGKPSSYSLQIDD